MNINNSFPFIEDIYYSLVSRFNIDIQIKKIYKNWILQLGMNDIFRTEKYYLNAETSNLRNTYYRYGDNQSVSLTISYILEIIT